MHKPLTIQALSTFDAPGSRRAQEDHVLCRKERGIFIVADGFGGPAAGVEASKVSCEAVRDFLDREAGDLDATLPFVLRSYFSLAGNVLFNAILHANQKLMKLNRERGVHERGGASLIAGFLDRDLLALASVGSCQAWIFRGGQERELVTPRTLGRVADPFAVDVPESLRVPLAALGLGWDLEPEILEARIQPGDWVLMATDGFPSEGREILKEIQGRGLPPGVANQEIQMVLQGCPYRDNVAVSVVCF